MIKIKNITKNFVSSENNKLKFEVLSNVTLNINKGEFVVFLGPSGCGKSTLLDIISGLTIPDEGKIVIDGEYPITAGKHSSMVFQNYALIPWKNVKANIEYVLKIKKIPREKWASIVEKSLTEVGLEKFKKSYPKQLSGGMQQRVALARALVSDTKILLMDEPFAALDAITRENLQDTFIELVKDKGKTIVFVTHSLDEAIKMADKIVVFSTNPGKIEKIFSMPLVRGNRELMSKNLLDIKNEIIQILNKNSFSFQSVK